MHRAAIVSLALCVFQCGCAVYDPYRVWRWSFDFNTEREFAAQAVTYEHLPPRPVRTRLTTWAYNPGPAQTTAPVAPALPPAPAVQPTSNVASPAVTPPQAPPAAWLFASP